MGQQPLIAPPDRPGDRSTEIAATLRAARALIEKPENWWQGPGLGLGNTGMRCAGFAILDAAPQPVNGLALQFFEKFIGCCVVGWNDTPNRHHDEILETFDRAIAKATGG
jgi:hypothetical protein